MQDIEYGRFPDRSPGREYVVTNGLNPGVVRVWAIEKNGEPEQVCTIYSLSSTPYASWGARWVTNMRHWKSWLIGQASSVYFAHYRAATPARVRQCDG